MADPQAALFGSDPVILPQGGPLYLQLKRWIEAAVARGAIKPGDALPSERDLASKVDVSRVTVRKAVQYLVQDGVLVQRHGSGTFVAPQPSRVEQSLGQLTSFAEDMARRGLPVRSVFLDRGIYDPSPEEVMALGLSPGESFETTRELVSFCVVAEPVLSPAACLSTLGFDEPLVVRALTEKTKWAVANSRPRPGMKLATAAPRYGPAAVFPMIADPPQGKLEPDAPKELPISSIDRERDVIVEVCFVKREIGEG